MTSVFLLIPDLSFGGAQRVASDLSCYLPYDLNFKVITLSNINNVYECRDGTLLSLNVPTMVNYPKYLRFPRVIVGLIRYSILLSSEKPDVSLSMLQPANIMNIFCCLITGTKSIMSIRGWPFPESFSSIERAFNYITLKIGFYFSKMIIMNSDGINEKLMLNYGLSKEKGVVIYNPKDISQIQLMAIESVDEDFFSTSDPIIITVGRLAPLKGHWHLIRVFAAIHSSKRCKLVICGAGPLQAYLETLARDLGVRADIFFLGWCSNPYKYVAKSTLFAFSSLSEAQPNALIEALICGCPVVSADCDFGPREILDNGKYGLLSKSLDGIRYGATDPLTVAERDMMEKIMLLIENKEMRMRYSLLSLERAKQFNKDIIIDKYYQEIMKVCTK